VVYSGDETEVDLNKIKEAILGFTFYIDDGTAKTTEANTPDSMIKDSMIRVKWNGLELNTLIKPGLKQKNL